VKVQRPQEKFVDEKSEWSPTWQVVEKGAWSAGIWNFGKPWQ